MTDKQPNPYDLQLIVFIVRGNIHWNLSNGISVIYSWYQNIAFLHPFAIDDRYNMITPNFIITIMIMIMIIITINIITIIKSEVWMKPWSLLTVMTVMSRSNDTCWMFYTIFMALSYVSQCPSIHAFLLYIMYISNIYRDTDTENIFTF